jgi:hypothetical protein
MILSIPTCPTKAGRNGWPRQKRMIFSVCALLRSSSHFLAMADLLMEKPAFCHNPPSRSRAQSPYKKTRGKLWEEDEKGTTMINAKLLPLNETSHHPLLSPQRAICHFFFFSFFFIEFPHETQGYFVISFPLTNHKLEPSNFKKLFPIFKNIPFNICFLQLTVKLYRIFSIESKLMPSQSVLTQKQKV